MLSCRIYNTIVHKTYFHCNVEDAHVLNLKSINKRIDVIESTIIDSNRQLESVGNISNKIEELKRLVENLVVPEYKTNLNLYKNFVINQLDSISRKFEVKTDKGIYPHPAPFDPYPVLPSLEAIKSAIVFIETVGDDLCKESVNNLCKNITDELSDIFLYKVMLV